MESPKVTTASEYRKKKEFTVVVNPDLTVLMRRLDMPTMLLNGLLPLPMLAAAQKFEKLQNQTAEFNEKDPDAAGKAAKLVHELEELGFLELMRRYTCVAVLAPTFKMTDEECGPNDLPVALLDVNDLLTIWNEGNNRRDTVATNAVAEEFRRAEPAAAGAPGQAGGEVREQAQFLDFGDREAATA